MRFADSLKNERCFARPLFGRADLPALSGSGGVNCLRLDGPAGESGIRFADHRGQIGRGNRGTPIFQHEKQDGERTLLCGSLRRGPEGVGTCRKKLDRTDDRDSRSAGVFYQEEADLIAAGVICGAALPRNPAHASHRTRVRCSLYRGHRGDGRDLRPFVTYAVSAPAHSWPARITAATVFPNSPGRMP